MTQFAELSQRSLFPYRLVLVVGAIGILGVLNIYSAGHSRGAAELETTTATTTTHTGEHRKAEDKWRKQIVWLAVGLIAAVALLRFDYRGLERVAYPLYAIVIALLLLVLAIGTAKLGAKRWLALPGGANLQPSEIMKIAIVLVLARYFADERRERGYNIRDLLRPLNISRPLGALLALVYFWNKNVWLGDPVGELSRRVSAGYGGVPPEWDGNYFFRALLCTGLLAYVAFAAYLWSLGEKQLKAFEQRSPTARRVRGALLFGPAGVIALLCYVFWQAELMGDPKAVVVTWLVEAGSATGSHAEYAPVLWFRLLLLLGGIVYLLYAVLKQFTKAQADLRDFVAPIDLVLVPMALIMKQPDLGTAMLVGAISFSLILFIGMRWTSVVLLGMSGVGLSVMSWFALLKDYQKRRVLTFLDPEWDAKGAGYHAIQSTIAVGSGGWTGKNFMKGTQSTLEFLPEPHTDFAFAVWGEEQGFLGCLALVTLYFILIVLAVGIAARARDKFGALLVTGFTALIFWQAFVNMGMVTGILPVVGVPLPIFSYGGSSLFSVMIGLGICMNVAYRRNTFT